MKMPKTKKEFENHLIGAFNQGLNYGYGVKHTDIYNEENEFRLMFVKENKFSKETIQELENQYEK